MSESELDARLNDADFVDAVKQEVGCLHGCVTALEFCFAVIFADDGVVRSNAQNDITSLGETSDGFSEQLDKVLALDFIRLDELAQRYLHSPPGEWSAKFITELEWPPDANVNCWHRLPKSVNESLLRRFQELSSLCRLIRNDKRANVGRPHGPKEQSGPRSKNDDLFEYEATMLKENPSLSDKDILAGFKRLHPKHSIFDADDPQGAMRSARANRKRKSKGE